MLKRRAGDVREVKQGELVHHVWCLGENEQRTLKRRVASSSRRKVFCDKKVVHAAKDCWCKAVCGFKWLLLSAVR